MPTTLHQERNASFVRTAMNILADHMARHERITRKELILKAIAMRPPYYYVDADRAADVLNYLRCHKWPEHPSLRQQMWMEFYNQVKEEMEGPRHLKLTKAVSFVLNFRRPSRYYITPEQAGRLLRGRIISRSYVVRS